MPLVVLLLSLAVPAPALGIVLTTPGKAGADQYFETIPTSAGNVAPPAGGSAVGPTTSGGAGGTGSSLAAIGNGRAGERGLSKLGADGKKAAALAEATAPGTISGLPSGSSGAPGPSVAVAPPDGSGGSASGGLSALLTGSDAGGIGLLLPLTMVLGLVGAIVAGLRRGALKA
jgi:hypothetical protein